MNYSGRLLSLFTLTLLGLSSCFKQMPIEDDINQKKAAITVAEKYVAALKDSQLEKMSDMSALPYWLDGTVVHSPEILNRELRKMLSKSESLKRLQTVNARFYARADLEIFAPRLLSQMQEQQMQGDYFVVLQMIDPSVDRETEGVLFLMLFEDGKWQISGLSD